MRVAFLLVLVVHAACAAPAASPSPDAGVDAGEPSSCGDVVCAEGERCLEKASKPGVSACVEAGACDARPAGADPFGDALAAVGLTRCTATIPEDFFGGRAPVAIAKDPRRLPHFDRLHANPLGLPGWSDVAARAFATPKASVAILEAARRLGVELDSRPVSRDALGDAPLVEAVTAFAAAFDASAPAGLAADAADVPIEVQRALAPLVQSVTSAAIARREAFAVVADLALFQRCAPAVLLPTAGCNAFSIADDWVKPLFDGAIALPALYQEAFDIAVAVEALPVENLVNRSGFAFDQRTPAGRIVIADAGAQVSAAGGHVALLIDLGGDDMWKHEAGATTPGFGVGVHVDVAGNDTYAYREVAARGDDGRLASDGAGRNREGDVAQGATAISLSTTARQGAAVTGLGLLFDLAGNDSYTSLRESQGFAAFGVGVLADLAGDDVYRAEAGAQGSALYGLGLLLDGAGDDERRTYAYGQGFGFAQGVGVLADLSGKDVNYANPGDPANGGDPLYFNPQRAGRGNSSFVQGAGFGRRDDSGATAISGGLGVCADFGAGDDDYTASVFAQGTGYWYGTGVLFDEGGNDLYDGFWYVRGSDAHFALASFHDVAGNDRHNTRFAGTATSLGVGHDHSIGWLVDDAGDDTYVAPGLSMGSGNACGMGFFVDASGDDTYDARGLSLGRFGDPKGCSWNLQATIGVMVDAGGRDSYTLDGAPIARDGATTVASAQADAPLAKAVHVDAEGTVLVLP